MDGMVLRMQCINRARLYNEPLCAPLHVYVHTHTPNHTPNQRKAGEQAIKKTFD